MQKRMANTMLEFKKQNDIKKIWFDMCTEGGWYYLRTTDDKDILKILYLNPNGAYVFPAYKPFFMTNPNNDDNLNDICIEKDEMFNGNVKWIATGFRDNNNGIPSCKITFITDKNNNITQVEIVAETNEYTKTTYTISLNEKRKVVKITKKDENNTENKDYKDEIKKLLFEDEINKHLTENIKYELDSQQKQVFDKIKEDLGVEEEQNKKKGETKEEKKQEEKNNDFKQRKNNEDLFFDASGENQPEYKYRCFKCNNDCCGWKKDGNGFGCCGW